MKIPKMVALIISVCSMANAEGFIGKPAIFNYATPQKTQLEIILNNGFGDLIWGDARINAGGRTEAMAAAGPVSVMPSNWYNYKNGYWVPAQYHYIYRDVNGRIQDVWLDHSDLNVHFGLWRLQQLNCGGVTDAPAAAGDPSTYWYYNTQQSHVYYRDINGNIQDVWYYGGWRCQQMNNGGLTDAPGAAGDPIPILGNNNQPHIVYRDINGNIQDIWSDGSWHVQRLNNGGNTDAPSAVGNPVEAMFKNQHHVSYRDQNGNIWDTWYDGAWHKQKLNNGGNTNAPIATGDPAVFIFNNSQHHVIYRDQGGSIWDVYYDGSWHCQKLNNGGNTIAPSAASDPVCLSPADWQYVSYVDINGDGVILEYYMHGQWKINKIVNKGR